MIELEPNGRLTLEYGIFAHPGGVKLTVTLDVDEIEKLRDQCDAEIAARKKHIDAEVADEIKQVVDRWDIVPDTGPHAADCDGNAQCWGECCDPRSESDCPS